MENFKPVLCQKCLICNVEQLQAEIKQLKSTMRSIHQRALNAAPIHDIVVLSEEALKGE